MDLEGKVAIISGGLGDIGKAISIELAKHGAYISLGDVKEPKLANDFLKQVNQYTSKVMYTQVDIRNTQSVERWVTNTKEKLGIPSLIISNAGIVTRKSLLEITETDWNNEFSVNVYGALALCQSAAKHLIESNLPGKIVLVGSWAAHRPNQNIPAYCSSKSALRMLGQVMALEFSQYNIVVNEVAPGVVNAGLSSENLRKMEKEDILEKIPVGKWIEPEEVALHVAHLCNPRNKNTTGNVFIMDGGLSLTSKWVK